MQEFSSISVSSYEAAALAGKLTEQAADGWNVVAIVPTGSTVTAYLSRPTTTTSVATTTDEPKPAAATETPTQDEPKAEHAGTAQTVAQTVAETENAETENAETENAEPAGATTTASAAASAHVTPSLPERGTGSSPVDEPAGWALQPESAGSAATAAPATAAPASATPASATPASAAPPSATPASTTAASASTTAAAAAAPAGWYADPSSRYELRYWDGNQWTEHVSRGGQQFTDPPVA
jgi:ribonuclease E